MIQTEKRRGAWRRPLTIARASPSFGCVGGGITARDRSISHQNPAQQFGNAPTGQLHRGVNPRRRGCSEAAAVGSIKAAPPTPNTILGRDGQSVIVCRSGRLVWASTRQGRLIFASAGMGAPCLANDLNERGCLLLDLKERKNTCLRLGSGWHPPLNVSIACG